MNCHGRRGRADGFRKANDFLDSFTLHVEPNEQCGNLRVGALAGQYLGHDGPRFFAGERLAMICDAMKSVSDHRWIE